MAQVALDYRQRDTCLDKPAGVGVPEIMHPGLFGEAPTFGPRPSRLPDIGVEVLRSNGTDGCSGPAPAGVSE